MSRRHLTQKQHQFLEFLQTRVQEQKVWPTYREIVDFFQYRSPNSVTQNLQALAKKGYLRRDHNGYHLIDRKQREGSVAVRATIRNGRLDQNPSLSHFSITSLFPDVDELHAIRLEGENGRPQGLEDAEYIFLAHTEDVPTGELAAVLHRGSLSLRRIEPDGTLVDPNGDVQAIEESAADIMGRYVGHAGPYGVVRHAPASVAQQEEKMDPAVVSFA